MGPSKYTIQYSTESKIAIWLVQVVTLKKLEFRYKRDNSTSS